MTEKADQDQLLILCFPSLFLFLKTGQLALRPTSGDVMDVDMIQLPPPRSVCLMAYLSHVSQFPEPSVIIAILGVTPPDAVPNACEPMSNQHIETK